MVEKSVKTTYKLKNVLMRNDHILVDEEGNEFDLIHDLEKLFEDTEFTLTAAVAETKKYDSVD